MCIIIIVHYLFGTEIYPVNQQHYFTVKSNEEDDFLHDDKTVSMFNGRAGLI